MKTAKEVIILAKQMKALDIASWVLCTIAALQLGIWGVFNYDVLGLLGSLTWTIYLLIGLAGLLSVWHMITMCSKK